jgi:hypothetical protein
MAQFGQQATRLAMHVPGQGHAQGEFSRVNAPNFHIVSIIACTRLFLPSWHQRYVPIEMFFAFNQYFNVAAMIAQSCALVYRIV